MREIRLLDPVTINRIAAGEVIENASSVVKELVENSLDSGADSITIETLAGGQGSVVIRDNGCGMTEEEILLALERHATSKISAFEDLYALNSLGFRGEALPSIASVSRMEILSSTNGREASRVFIDGGDIGGTELGVRSKGTTISVSSLFYNVPARKKFQKHPNADKIKIRRLLEGMVLAFDNVAWSWVSEGQEDFSVSKSMSFEERVAFVMGEAFFDSALPIHSKDPSGQMEVHGFLGASDYHRPSRQGQKIFLNGRIVELPFVGFRVEEACGTIFPVRRYPVFVLKLTLPPDWCDVNVHPQKAVVRIREEQKLGPFIYSAISSALASSVGRKVVQVSSDIGCGPSFDSQDSSKIAFPDKDRFYFSGSSHKKVGVLDSFEQIKNQLPKKAGPLIGAFSEGKIKIQGIEQSIREEENKQEDISFGSKEVRPLTWVGEYLFAEDAEGLHMVHIPSANKFLLFYSVVEKTSQAVNVQKLLCPIILEVTAEEGSILMEYQELFASIGFDLRPVGKTSFAIESAPTSICEEEISLWIFSALSTLQTGKGDSPDYFLQKLFTKPLPKKSSKIFSEERLRLFWSLGRPEKGFDGTLIRRLVLEVDLSKWFRVYG
ncbi:DNA mismatch repair endonuclease MutL [Chlamydiifrater phoenicopteri]|uniref:DNA mismatch repair endonuclease MutL n=1 Tax=Chlamydiifrater phoenicopteri TaxID=2681469 RepID=UPI001BCF6814|nr:DNA mismatch repair endonuclease MutL [Chlamydiifrater phoenicopteri]